MKQLTRISFVILLVILLSLPHSFLALNINASSAILVDLENGNVLYDKSIDEQRGIASITKILSVFIFLEEIEKQGISLSETTKISERVSKLKAQSIDISGGYFYENQEITLEKLLELAIVYSDNSAIVQLAEVSSTSEEKHVEKMNEKIKEWNLENTIMYNVSGLTMRDYGVLQLSNTNPENYNVSTTKELAIMLKNIVQKRPEILNYTVRENVDYNNEKLSSYNLMLPNKVNFYEGVIGLKTGTTLEAGSCFAGIIEYEGKKYLSIVLDSKNNRFIETKNLYDWLKTIKINNVIDKSQKIDITVYGDLNFKNNIYINEEIYSLNEENVNIIFQNLKYNEEFFHSNNKLKKSIPEKGIVATVEIKNLNLNFRIKTLNTNGDITKVNLVTENKIQYQGELLKFIVHIKVFINELFENII